MSLERIYQLEAEGLHRLAGSYIIEMIEALFATSNTESVDHILEDMNVYKMGVYSLVATVRTTARARAYLPHWGEFYDKCSERLDFLQQDTAGLLVGLNR